MPDPTPSAASHPIAEDQAIRERVKELTTRALQEGRIDPEAVRDIFRAVIGATPDDAAVTGAQAREEFIAALTRLDQALVKSAREAHDALQQLATRGKDLSANDLKNGLVSLGRLEHDCTAAAGCIAEAMTGNLRREMTELAIHAQNLGVEASARVASIMDEFAERVGATAGTAKMRDATARFALLGSGLLAGVADALRDRKSEPKTGL